MNRLGLSLFASSNDNDWPALLALRPRSVVAIDPYHLPRALPLADTQYWLWRPWVPGTMRAWTPRAWFERVYAEWTAKGGHPFHGILPLNEPNLASESGFPNGSREAAAAAVAWGRELLPLLRAAWPSAEMHSPPLSPMVPGWTSFYRWLAPLIRDCAVLNVHTYLNDPTSYEFPAALYPDMPLVISECGDGQYGTADYGRQLRHWAAGLPERVRWAAIYVYNSTNGQDPAWELRGTPAERILIAEG